MSGWYAAVALLDFFRPAADAALVKEPAVVARLYARWRRSVFLSITLGYTVFYTTRLSTSVSKDSMIQAGVLTIGQAGVIDSIFLVSYALGKTANGFLADRVSPRRFFATALAASAVANCLFGVSSTFVLFALLWVINGWVQSVGVPTSGVVMSSWFASRELGTRYSVWSMSHHMGEGLTFLLSARLIAAASAAGAGTSAWRAAFLGPAALSALVALVLYKTLADRPQTKGLPAIGEHMPAPNESVSAGASASASESGKSLRTLQLEVLKNPWVWVCGLASALMYVSRYAINNWGVYYLQKADGYSVEDAGAALSVFPIVGIGGVLLAGPLSDKLAGGRRAPVALAYGLVLCVSLGVFYSATGAQPWIVRGSLACAGFAMGGMLAFLGGLIAMEICSKRAAGTALGVVGGFSYLGAGLQSLASGYLIERGRTVRGDVIDYDFTPAKWLWLGAPCLCVVLTAALLRAERRAPPAG
jgi:OPA family sugar phosphate sensor protein UhpC-like MFS transporter